MDRHRPADTTNARRLRRLLPALFTLLVTLAVAAGVLHWHAQYRADREAQAWAESLGRSTAILIQPLLLADDRVSLNYLFNELDSQPLLNGLKLTDTRRLVVAVSGEEQGIARTLVLNRGEETLGELTLWISREPVFTPLREQLVLVSGALGVSLLLSLIVLLLRLRQPPAQAPDFREVAAAHYPELLADPAPTAAAHARADADEPVRLDDLEPTDPLRDDVDTHRAPAASSTRMQAEEDSDAPIAFEFDAPETPAAEPASAPEPEPAPELETDLASESDPEPRPEPRPEQELHPEPLPRAPMPEQQDVDLVALLKPDRDAPQSMPHFSPAERADELDAEEALAPDLEQVEFDDEDDELHELGEDPARRRPNLALVSGLNRRDEEQLGLYTLEHELELMLSAEDAGYLFLIDTNSAHADNIEAEERKTLLRHYRTLANSVAHIYSGRVESLADGDLQLFFDDPSADDSHGINALCSALLFTGLYKQYNQYRIRQFKPVMNLHMAVVRGHYQKRERLLEEARFLTRTTHSNELISHTGLTEAPDLKESLLEGADIRREDEDKVLIMRVAKSYQELLDKQARYLLSKLQSREQEQQPS